VLGFVNCPLTYRHICRDEVLLTATGKCMYHCRHFTAMSYLSKNNSLYHNCAETGTMCLNAGNCIHVPLLLSSSWDRTPPQVTTNLKQGWLLAFLNKIPTYKLFKLRDADCKWQYTKCAHFQGNYLFQSDKTLGHSTCHNHRSTFSFITI